MNIKCFNCQKEFNRHKSHLKPINFCSLKCSNEHRTSNADKTCKNCSNTKNKDEFRSRNSTKKGKKYVFLVNICKVCEKESAEKYYSSKKDDEIFKEKNRIRTKSYSQRNSEKVNNFNKERRKKQEFKERHKSYCRKYNYTMPDHYIIKNLKSSNTPINADNISLKRVQILINRINRKIKENEK